jgi:hypothetical protein
MLGPAARYSFESECSFFLACEINHCTFESFLLLTNEIVDYDEKNSSC